MNPQIEKLRSVSHKNKRQIKNPLLTGPKSPKKTNDDTKITLFKKVPETFGIVDYSADYTIKEVKSFRASQQNINNNNNNISPNGNLPKFDGSNHQAYLLSTTVFKLDKDAIFNLNGGNNASSQQPQIVDGDSYFEMQNKRFNNFLHIKSVTLTNQTPTAKKLMNPSTKIVLPSINQSEKVEKKNDPREDKSLERKKKLPSKSSSRLKSQILLNQDRSKLASSHILTDPDDNYQLETVNKERLSQSAKRHRDTRPKFVMDNSNKNHASESSTENTSQPKNIQDPSSLASNTTSTSASNTMNNSGNIGSTNSGTNSRNATTPSNKILKNNSSLSPHRFGPLQEIKEAPIKRLNNNINTQKQTSLLSPKIQAQSPTIINTNTGSNSISLNQSNILTPASPKIIFINNPPGATSGNATNSNITIQKQNKNDQQIQKQVSTVQEEKKKTYIPPPANNNFKYYVGSGNNGELVKRIMNKRDWWEECEEYNSLFNFKWQQSHRGYKYERLIQNPAIKQIVNHFENHKEISTKNLLIKNLANYCEQNKLTIFDITPTTFVLDMDDEANFESDMQNFAKFFIKNHPHPEKYPKPEGIKNANIYYNFDFRIKKSGYTTSEKKSSLYLKPKMHRTFNKGFNVWLLKPTGYNRGRGIEVFNTLEALNGYINEYFDGFVEVGPNQKRIKKSEAESDDSDDSDEEDKKKLKGPIIKSHTFVLQKYVESPLLINQRKFDVRVWAMITQDMNLYFFKEGYLRLSSEIFTLNEENIDNKFVHLTNNAVQKYSENYGQFENGNQLSFEGFENYMIENGMLGDFKGKMLPRMKELVSISMNSVKKSINLYDRKYCLEIFGYDFFIDSDFTVWLIEVNTNPCIEESSPILEKYLPRMLDDAFKLTLDVLFPRPFKKSQPGSLIQNLIQEGSKLVQNNNNNSDPQSKPPLQQSNIASTEVVSPTNPKDSVYPVDGYKDDENMWEFLCSLQVIKSPSKKLPNLPKKML